MLVMRKPKQVPASFSPDPSAKAVPEASGAFAIYDRNMALCDGLFVPISRRADRGRTSTIHYPGEGQFTPDGVNIKVRMHERLNTWDESVLLCSLMIMAKRGKHLTPPSAGEVPPRIWQALNPSKHTANPTLVVEDASYGEFLRLLGKTSTSGSRAALKKSFERLTATTLWVTQRGGSLGGSMNLLGVFFDDEAQALELSIHYGLARAILNPRAGGWAWVHYDERMALDGDVAKSVHRRLCAWLSVGERGKIKLSTLEMRIWGENSIGDVRWERFRSLRNAFHEVSNLRGSFHIAPAAGSERGDVTYVVSRRPGQDAVNDEGAPSQEAIPLLGTDIAPAAVDAVCSIDIQTGLDAIVLASTDPSAAEDL